MKVLILAEDQQIATALSDRFVERGRRYCMAGAELLLTPSKIGRVLHDERIDLVINTLSFSLLDKTQETSLLDAVRNLAEACSHHHTILLQLSSSQVFDGLDGGRHRETDDVEPASRQGALCWQMEQAIQDVCSRHVILRLTPLFSAVGNNLLTTLLQRFQREKSITLSAVGSSSPLPCSDFSRVVSGIVDQLFCGAELWGTYHYTSSDPVSYYQFAESVLAVYLQHSDISVALECKESADANWARPLLNCDKLRNTFGIKQLPWRHAITGVIQEISGNKTSINHETNVQGRSS